MVILLIYNLLLNYEACKRNYKDKDFFGNRKPTPHFLIKEKYNKNEREKRAKKRQEEKK